MAFQLDGATMMNNALLTPKEKESGKSELEENIEMLPYMLSLQMAVHTEGTRHR